MKPFIIMSWGWEYALASFVAFRDVLLADADGSCHCGAIERFRFYDAQAGGGLLLDTKRPFGFEGITLTKPS